MPHTSFRGIFQLLGTQDQISKNQMTNTETNLNIPVNK